MHWEKKNRKFASKSTTGISTPSRCLTTEGNRHASGNRETNTKGKCIHVHLRRTRMAWSLVCSRGTRERECISMLKKRGHWRWLLASRESSTHWSFSLKWKHDFLKISFKAALRAVLLSTKKKNLWHCNGKKCKKLNKLVRGRRKKVKCTICSVDRPVICFVIFHIQPTTARWWRNLLRCPWTYHKEVYAHKKKFNILQWGNSKGFLINSAHSSQKLHRKLQKSERKVDTPLLNK